MYRARPLVSLLAFALLVPGAAFAVDTGSANFTNYVSAGDSLTAGFTSASLIDVSQRHDYPALIAQQAGVADFEQPLVSPPGIPGILTLQGLFPTIIAPSAGQGVPENLNLPRLYNNLAVPGETVHTMLTVVSDTQVPPFTPGLHDVILRGLGTQIQEVVGAKPTFVTLWIGNNDALGAATSGNIALLTPLAAFEADYKTIVGAIASTGAKMAIANIPDVTSIPFVTTLPPILVNPQTNQPVIINGSTVPLLGPNGPLSPGDHVLLSAGSFESQGYGIPLALGGNGKPLPAGVILTAGDAAAIDARVAQFNAFIQATANQLGAAYVDANSLLKELATTGIEVGGIPFTAAFLTGGVFSYDGVHPTPFGYAFIANAFIAAIDQQFGGDIPPASVYGAIFGYNGGVGEELASRESDDLEMTRGAVRQPVQPKYLLTTAAMKNLSEILDPPSVVRPVRRKR
jgi:lysophospholipase L1-like esterase